MLLPKPKAMPEKKAKDRVVTIRGQNVITAPEAAVLFKVSLDELRTQLRKHKKRFPKNFMLELSGPETEKLSQNGLPDYHLSKAPYAFTDYGLVMLAFVLESDKAVNISSVIAESYPKMREFIGL